MLIVYFPHNNLLFVHLLDSTTMLTLGAFRRWNRILVNNYIGVGKRFTDRRVHLVGNGVCFGQW